MKTKQQPSWIQDWVKEDFSDAVEKTIVEAEKKCALDFFPVVVKASTPLGHVFPLLSLIFFMIFAASVLFVPLPIKDVGMLYAAYALIAAVVLLLSYSLSESMLVARLLTSKIDQEAAVKKAAKLAYYEHGIYEYASILIYVSLTERKTLLLCNPTVQDKIDQTVLDKVIHSMMPKLKRKQLQAAVIEGIEMLSKLTQSKFPKSDHNSNNVLSNQVVIEE